MNDKAEVKKERPIKEERETNGVVGGRDRGRMKMRRGGEEERRSGGEEERRSGGAVAAVVVVMVVDFSRLYGGRVWLFARRAHIGTKV